MGFSATLLNKDFIELSLEIDRDLFIEMSTGFGSGNRVTTSTSIPVTLDDISNIIKDLTVLRDELAKSWKCQDCGVINREDVSVCINCDKEKK